MVRKFNCDQKANLIWRFLAFSLSFFTSICCFWFCNSTPTIRSTQPTPQAIGLGKTKNQQKLGPFSVDHLRQKVRAADLVILGKETNLTYLSGVNSGFVEIEQVMKGKTPKPNRVWVTYLTEWHFYLDDDGKIRYPDLQTLPLAAREFYQQRNQNPGKPVIYFLKEQDWKVNPKEKGWTVIGDDCTQRTDYNGMEIGTDEMVKTVKEIIQMESQ